MSDLFFDYQDYDAEIKKKIESRQALISDSVNEFISFLKKKQTDELVIQKAQKLIESLVQDVTAEVNKPHYFSHPLRVTAAFLKEINQYDYENISLGLCHNLKEKTGNQFEFFNPELLSPETKKIIKVLTIDRAHERESKYLNQYYDRIMETSNDLMILKAHDKLDNALCWPLFNFEKYHADIIYDHVCPRIKRLDPKLGNYLNDLTKYALEESSKQKYRDYSQMLCSQKLLRK